jgi:hypothetical protein
MADREFEASPTSTHVTHTDIEGPQKSSATINRETAPVDQVTCRAGDGSCAAAHAASINRATGSQPKLATKSLLHLQRQYGNRYVGEVLARAKEDAEPNSVHPTVERDIQSQRGGGQPLDTGVRGQMESSFGADFSRVRVHTGVQADSLNHELSARAFTTGHDIFFRHGAYQPGSTVGRELLAHELTHVVQQNGDQVKRSMSVSQPGDPHELEAEHTARVVMQREQQGVSRDAAPAGPHEHDKDKDKDLHHHVAMASCSSCEAERQPEVSHDEEEKKKHHHAMMSADRSVVGREVAEGEQ